MPITERTLKKWRKEALKIINVVDSDRAKPDARNIGIFESMAYDSSKRILNLTQELLDQHLLRK